MESQFDLTERFCETLGLLDLYQIRDLQSILNSKEILRLFPKISALLLNESSVESLRPLFYSYLENHVANDLHDNPAPTCLSVFPNLKILNLSSTGLRELDFIQYMPKLESINAEGNFISIFPVFESFTCLRRINLKNNYLTSLPDSIGKCQCIEELDFSHNALTELPLSLGQCQQLTKLDLSYNEFKTFPNATLRVIPNLKYLSLKHNRIKAIDFSLEVTEEPNSNNLNNNRTKQEQYMDSLDNLEINDIRNSSSDKHDNNDVSSFISGEKNQNNVYALEGLFTELGTMINDVGQSYQLVKEELGSFDPNYSFTTSNHNVATTPPDTAAKIVSEMIREIPAIDFNDSSKNHDTFNNNNRKNRLKDDSFSEDMEMDTDLNDMTFSPVSSVSSSPSSSFSSLMNYDSKQQTRHHQQQQQQRSTNNALKSVNGYQKLEYLSLKNNRLCFISPNIKNLKRLKDFDCKRNRLTVIPKEISYCSNIARLDFSHNLLQQLPKEIIQLSSLKTFNLTRNKFLHVPCALWNFITSRARLEHNVFRLDDKQFEVSISHDSKANDIQYVFLDKESDVEITNTGPSWSVSPLPLEDLCSQLVWRKKVDHSECDLPEDTDINYDLDNMPDVLKNRINLSSICDSCKNIRFRESELKVVLKFDKKIVRDEFDHNVSIGTEGNNYVPIQYSVCSYRCMKAVLKANNIDMSISSA